MTYIWVHNGSGNGLVPDLSHSQTNFDLSSIKSSDIHPRTILQEIFSTSITEISLKLFACNFIYISIYVQQTSSRETATQILPKQKKSTQ